MMISVTKAPRSLRKSALLATALLVGASLPLLRVVLHRVSRDVPFDLDVGMRVDIWTDKGVARALTVEAMATRALEDGSEEVVVSLRGRSLRAHHASAHTHVGSQH
jgi:hypothetical protein